MVFTSYEFIGFLAIVLLLYYVIPRKWQWPFLLLAGYVFYFIADPRYLIFILTTTATIYLGALMLTKMKAKYKEEFAKVKGSLDKEGKKAMKDAQHRKEFRVLLVTLLFNLLILAFVKYINFFISNINSVIAGFHGEGKLSLIGVIVPMGISFYTFQAIGYLLDVYKGKYEAEKNVFRFALFVSFFPLLVQGPISRFDQLSRSLYEEHPFEKKNFTMGLQRILWGFFKKLVIADRLSSAVILMISDSQAYRGAYALVLLVLYTVQLYADFTGGIDVTIGIAQSMGIKVSENFRRPYFSTSLKEYWRRWHISMCSWFRDYVFFPVSISSPMRKISKFAGKHLGTKVGRRLPVYLSTLIVWFLTGLWHGAGWNFIVWGMLNALILMISEELEPLYKKFHERFAWASKLPYKIFEIARTLVLIAVLNLFDCFEKAGETLGVLASVFTGGNWQIFTNGSLLALGLSVSDYLVVFLGCLVMLSVSLVQVKGSVRERIAAKPMAVRTLIWFLLFMAVVLLGAYGIGYDASQFIYNRF